MANISIADQLDDAIEMMIAEPGSVPPKVDLKIGELLGIAAELRLLPDPAFRAVLKAELVGQRAVAGTQKAVKREPTPVRRDSRTDEILPSLFGAGLGNYPVHRGNFAISLGLHAALIALFVAVGVMARESGPKPQVTTTFVADMRAYLPLSGGNGGGGDRGKMRESQGQLPRVAREQLTPPTIVVRSEEPKLAVEPTIVGPPVLTFPTSQLGNPLSTILGPASNGTGTGGGIGAGNGSGVGSGVGAYFVGGGVSAPRAIYDPEPEYSEEARQAKYQGSVYLAVVVGSDGRAHEIRVQRSLGMGLDEKAIEAVRKWKFEPSMKNGVAVAVQVTIEVSFRLL